MGVNAMKWPKLLRKMYDAILEKDIAKEKELYEKALKKNLKANLKNKKTTVTQVIVRD
jgi:dihydrodipicolinate synthase/N-acetylneuraminate lyase